MRLSDITAESVRDAIAECDRLGREAFRRQYGYRAALEYELEYGGRRYDSKAIIGVAYQFATGQAPRSFTGGEQTVVKRLGQLGFTVVRLSAAGPGRDYWWHSARGERFWVEIRRVPEGLGRELRCPLVDVDGHRNGWWDLVDDIRAGDCIYHWNADQGRFVGRSFAARSRAIDDQTGERVVPLTGFLPLTVTVGLEANPELEPSARSYARCPWQRGSPRRDAVPSIPDSPRRLALDVELLHQAPGNHAARALRGRRPGREQPARPSRGRWPLPYRTTIIAGVTAVASCAHSSREPTRTT